MTMTTTYELPAFVGSTKQNLIGGRWAPAASGETIDVINPATGSSLGAIAAGGAADVDAAVEAGAHRVRGRVVAVDSARASQAAAEGPRRAPTTPLPRDSRNRTNVLSKCICQMASR
ncbi:hypothetical protein ACWEN3_04790 [Streptomyces sp. NPDC004561]